MVYSIILYLNMLAFIPATNTVTLQEALDQQLVKATVTANPSGTHYQNPVIIHLTNLTPVTKKVIIENGRTFLPDDPGQQPVIVVASTIIEIPPGGSKDAYVRGMCYSQHLIAPKEGNGYCVGEMATGDLAMIAHFIQSKNLQGLGAQNAIWCITDSKKLESIVDWDEAKARELTDFVADLKDTEAPGPADKNDYARNLHATPVLNVGGNFECNLQEQAEVHIGLFDKNGVIVRELYYNPAERIGSHTIAYAFDASVYTDNYYVVKYLENNQVVREKKVQI